jgi:hypothetical protein
MINYEFIDLYRHRVNTILSRNVRLVRLPFIRQVIRYYWGLDGQRPSSSDVQRFAVSSFIQDCLNSCNVSRAELEAELEADDFCLNLNWLQIAVDAFYRDGSTFGLDFIKDHPELPWRLNGVLGVVNHIRGEIAKLKTVSDAVQPLRKLTIDEMMSQLHEIMCDVTSMFSGMDMQAVLDSPNAGWNYFQLITRSAWKVTVHQVLSCPPLLAAYRETISNPDAYRRFFPSNTSADTLQQLAQTFRKGQATYAEMESIDMPDVLDLETMLTKEELLAACRGKYDKALIRNSYVAYRDDLTDEFIDEYVSITYDATIYGRIVSITARDYDVTRPCCAAQLATALYNNALYWLDEFDYDQEFVDDVRCYGRQPRELSRIYDLVHDQQSQISGFYLLVKRAGSSIVEDKWNEEAPHKIPAVALLKVIRSRYAKLRKYMNDVMMILGIAATRTVDSLYKLLLIDLIAERSSDPEISKWGGMIHEAMKKTYTKEATDMKKLDLARTLRAALSSGPTAHRSYLQQTTYPPMIKVKNIMIYKHINRPARGLMNDCLTELEMV